MNKQIVTKNYGNHTPNLNFRVGITENFSLIKHHIFKEVFSILENRQTRFAGTRKTIDFIFHEKVRQVLMEVGGMTKKEIDDLENSILRDAEKMRDVEITIDAPAGLFYELKRTDKTDLIYKKRAVCIPNFILNALLCEKLEEDFSREDILACDGFVKVENCIRLDVDKQLSRRGFLVPEYDSKTFLIRGIRVFRYPTDERSFVLRSREKNNSGGFVN